MAKPPCKNKNTRPRKRDECDSAIVVPPSFGRQSAPRQASNKAPANNAATRPGLLHSAGRLRDELSMRTAASAYTHRRLSAPVESASYSLHSLLGERIVWYYYRQGAEKCQAPWILYSSIRLLSDSGGLYFLHKDRVLHPCPAGIADTEHQADSQIQVATELPPALKKGRVIPITGTSRRVIPILIMDWNPISAIIPVHSSIPSRSLAVPHPA